MLVVLDILPGNVCGAYIIAQAVLSRIKWGLVCQPWIRLRNYWIARRLELPPLADAFLSETRMEPVELRPAYAWTCNECGRDNFCNGIIAEFSPEDLEELRQEHGIESHETGDWMSMPETVTCQHCQAEFESRHHSEA